MFNTILSGTVGSHAYGLAREGSDLDTLGIFSASMVELTSLDWNSHKETYTTASPVGDDETYHEVGKYIRLALKCNPTVSELLWLDEYQIQTPSGQLLVDCRTAFLSEKPARNAYLGYASAQLSKFSGLGFKPKHARHALRLVRQGATLLQEGRLDVFVPDPQVYWDFDVMSPEDSLNLLTKEFAKFEESSQKKSVLPDEPDREKVSDVLTRIRMDHIV